MSSKRKRVFRVEFDPEDVAQLSDLQIRQLLHKALDQTVLGAYQPTIVKQATRRPSKETSDGSTSPKTNLDPVFRSPTGD